MYFPIKIIFLLQNINLKSCKICNFLYISAKRKVQLPYRKKSITSNMFNFPEKLEK